MLHLGRARAVRAGAVVAIIAGAVTIGLSGGAGAAPVPFPAGTTTFRFTSTVTIGTSPPITLTGQMVGTSDGAGKITFPASGVKINPATLVELGKNVTVTSVANGTTTVTLDTTTGLVTLTGSVTQTLNLSQLLPADTACVLGPVAQKFSSANSGGKKYTPTGTTATATVTGPVTLAPIAKTATCPDAATVNAALGTTGTTVQALTIFPPGVTVPSTTTTTAPATTTTVAPATTEPPVTAAAAASTLPRTGSSSQPMSLVGGGLILAGVAAVGLTRKRRTAD